MTLLGQTLAVAGASLAVTLAYRILRGRWDPGRATVVVAAALCAVMVAGHLTTASRTLKGDWSAGSGRSARQAQTLAGERVGVNTAYVEWLNTQIGSRQTYFLTPRKSAHSSLISGWLTFRLLPRVAVASARRADWLVVYRGDPGPGPLAAEGYGPVRWFAPGYGLARRNAG